MVTHMVPLHTFFGHLGTGKHPRCPCVAPKSSVLGPWFKQWWCLTLSRMLQHGGVQSPSGGFNAFVAKKTSVSRCRSTRWRGPASRWCISPNAQAQPHRRRGAQPHHCRGAQQPHRRGAQQPHRRRGAQPHRCKGAQQPHRRRGAQPHRRRGAQPHHRAQPHRCREVLSGADPGRSGSGVLGPCLGS